MRRAAILLAFGLVLTLLAVASQAGTAVAQSPRPGLNGYFDEPNPATRKALLAPVPPWAACEPLKGQGPVPRLCKDSSGKVDSSTFHWMGQHLRRTVNHLESLCEFDSAIVHALQECEFKHPYLDDLAIAGLMEGLASNWKRRGIFERADQLYAYAFAVLDTTGPGVSDRSGIARDWADLKRRQGDVRRAKELAYLHTEIERWKFDKTAPSAGLLIDALRFQADILERLGFPAEADAAAREVEVLNAIPFPCDGVCSRTMKEVR